MKRLIILAATLIAGLSACDSMLYKEPLDRVTQFDYFKTRSDLELFSNPFYDNLLDKTPYDEQNDLLVQMTLSDVLYGGDKRTVPNTGGGWSWGNLRRINTLLEYVDQCEDKKARHQFLIVIHLYRFPGNGCHRKDAQSRVRKPQCDFMGHPGLKLLSGRRIIGKNNRDVLKIPE